jgi:hypothetical protein
MRGFVNQKTSGISLVPMPTTEVISSMTGIKSPFKVDGVNLANYSLAYPISTFSCTKNESISNS